MFTEPGFRGEEFGSPWLRGYVRAKFRMDPVYAAVYERLEGSPRPLLDLGCGVGLLALYLRQRGFVNPITGVDFDERKITEARRVSPQWGGSLEFLAQDARVLPPFAGDVVMLDLLHYFSDGDQQSLLTNASRRVAPGGKLMIRECLRDSGWRYRLTYLEELLATSIRWIRADTLNFPTGDSIVGPLLAQGFSVEVIPLSGRMPFNNYLLTFTQPEQ